MKSFFYTLFFTTFLTLSALMLEAQSLLYENGTIVTNVAAGPGNNDVSLLQSSTLGMNTIGFSANGFAGAGLADDFTIPADTAWYVDEFIVYGYQTNSGLTSPYTAAYARVWSGTPGDPGSTIVFGDTFTNRMSSTQFSGIYRTTQTIGFGSSARPVMEVQIDAGIILESGTYWLEYRLVTTNEQNNWSPPITILGQTTTGNALQHGSGVGFYPLLDGGTDPNAGTQTPQGVSFKVFGIIAEELVLDDAIVQDATCFDASDGSIFLVLSGGESPFTYLWSNGATTEDLTGVAAGVYTVIVTDDIGQSIELEFEVGQPDELDWEIVELIDALCYGESNGSVEIEVVGGTAPYTVQWDPNTDDQTGFLAEELNAGTYFATITDDNGCTMAIAVEVGEADPLTPLTISGPTQVDENSETNYEVEDMEGWTYEWFVAGGNIVEGQGTHAITVLWISPGDGSVGIIAENPSGCETISSTGITIQEGVSVSDLNSLINIEMKPNPVQDYLHISHSKAMKITLHLYDMNGRLLKFATYDNHIYSFSLSDLTAGNYIIKLTDDLGHSYQTIISKH